jgi:hypothetical protein
MNSDKSRIEKIIDQINAVNAKKIALLLVIGFACYHGILHVRYGTNSCKWLLSDGRYKGDQEWQPYGCMLHRYTKMYDVTFISSKLLFMIINFSVIQENVYVT